MIDYIPVDYTSPPAIYAEADVSNAEAGEFAQKEVTRRAIDLMNTLDNEFMSSENFLEFFSKDGVDKKESEFWVISNRWKKLLEMLQFFSFQAGKTEIYEPFSPDEGEKSRDRIGYIMRSLCETDDMSICFNGSVVAYAAMGTTRTVENINKRLGPPKEGWMNYIYNK